MSDPSRRLVKLGPARAREAAETLARAFMNDPIQTCTFPDPVVRAELSVPHFEALVRLGLLMGEVWVTEGAIEAVGIWWPPDHKEIDEVLLDESGLAELPGVIGADAFGRFMSVIEPIERLHRREMPMPHWYAMVLGVEPTLHGQGLGRLLLRTVFDVADKQGVPCYLETAQPANVRFYTNSGFQLLLEDVEPTSGLRYWTFKREPAS
jgi:GNAT superfamily N-acetyltransferase